MTVLQNLIPAGRVAALAGDHAQPVALETIGLVQQALADIRRSLEGRGGAERDAAAIEYASWRRHLAGPREAPGA